MNDTSRLLLSENSVRLQDGGAQMSLLFVNYEPPRYPWHTKNHCHNNFELHFIPDGYGTLRVEGRAYSIVPGTFYITGPGVYHEQASDANQPMTEYCVGLDIRNIKQKDRPHGDLFRAARILCAHPFWFGTDDAQLFQLPKTMILEINRKKVGCVSALEALLTLVIVSAARKVSGDAASDIPIPKKDIQADRKFQLDVFFRQYDTDLKVSALAEALNVSVRQAERIVKSVYGVTFVQKLNEIRLDQAKAMLAETGRSIQEIAETVGFSNAGYFCRNFKMKFGETPTAFRVRNSLEAEL